MSIFLIGALGLAIDGSQMYAHRQMAQTAADAAAEAGAMSIYRGTNATSPYPFGTGANPASSICSTTDLRTPCVYARLNGFGGTAADIVTLSFPSTVPGVGLASASVPALSVKVQRTLKTGLIRFVGAAATSGITAKATAGLVGSVSSNCIYVLDPSAANSFLANNGATLVVNGCGIVVNSLSGSAASVTGGASVTTSAFLVRGGIAINNGGSVSPSPQTGAPPVADPFAAVAAPSVGACDFTNYNPGWGTYTLNPGTYCGGITMSNGATATFNPGVYIINGGGLTFAGGTHNSGSGVMFYLTGTNSTYRSVDISNGVDVTFSAPASGPYMGIVFFQDRAIVSSFNANVAGGATMRITGTLYFTTSSVLFSNGATVANYSTAIVAKQVSFVGGVNIKYDPTGQQTGLFSKSVALVQ